MTTLVTQTSALRRHFRPDVWSWLSGKRVPAFYRNLAISMPYSETYPTVASKHHHASGASLDPSIFEVDNEDEYELIALSLAPFSPHAKVPASDRSSLLLVRLIKARRFEDADRVRSEMIQIGLHVEPNHVFEGAAYQALVTEGEREQRLANFLAWLALIPPRDQKISLPKFDRFLYLLLEKLPPDIEFITQFAIVCVSKGYTQTFPQRIIPFVVHFVEPSISLAFLEEFHAAALRYKYHNASSLKPKLKLWYSQAIRGYALSGRLPHAVKALRLARRHGVNPTRFTYSFLLHRLKNGRGDLSEDIEYVTTLDQQQRISDTASSSQSFLKPPAATREQVNPLAYESFSGTNLVTSLRQLWRTVGTAKHPSAMTLAQFLDFYISTRGSLNAIQLLRRKTHRAGIRYRAHWAMAEMLYYGKKKQWSQVLSTFDDYFYSTGVPDEIHIYKKSSVHRRLRATRGLQARVFPSIFHTCLVWRALVEITHKTPALPIIYQRLIYQAEAIKIPSHPSSFPNQSISSSAIVPPPSQAFDGAHFTSFFYSLFQNARTNRMTTILSDMTRLSIEPTLPQLALLAGAHAMRGDFNKALAVLEMAEGTINEQRSKQAADIARDAIGQEDFQRFLVLYLPAFSGFLHRKHLRGAYMIRDKLFEYGYVKGSNELVESNLARLEEARALRKKRSLMQSEYNIRRIP